MFPTINSAKISQDVSEATLKKVHVCFLWKMLGNINKILWKLLDFFLWEFAKHTLLDIPEIIVEKLQREFLEDFPRETSRKVL